MFSYVSYDVSTAVFEGPFDLLLHLILREQVDIHEVSLSTIVDAYLTEIEKMQDLDLDIATEFLLIASTLVELKARRLLPGKENIDLDEEFALWEERDLLLARLLECKTFKDVSLVFQQLADLADRAFPRTTGPDERFSQLLPDLMEGVTPQKLHKAMLKALAPKPEPHIDLFHVAPVRLSVSEAVSELMDSLPSMKAITFRNLTRGHEVRLEVVVRFLAILEIYKQGFIELSQDDRFGDIEILWIGDEGFASVNSFSEKQTVD
jgi:segregation and condensation protein A